MSVPVWQAAEGGNNTYIDSLDRCRSRQGDIQVTRRPRFRRKGMLCDEITRGRDLHNAPTLSVHGVQIPAASRDQACQTAEFKWTVTSLPNASCAPGYHVDADDLLSAAVYYEQS